ncbi:MAG: hypothetical protein IH856_22305 [Deltaproteobacteria bacterium]|nr:hypothetical protein [Deltaproteobacteria bacterium]
MQPLFAHYYLDDQVYTITLTDCLDYASYENVADELYIRYGRRLDQTDVLIVRPPADRMISNLSEITGQLTPFVERCPRSEVGVLYSSDYSIELSENMNTKSVGTFLKSVDHPQFLEWLRERELRQYMHRSAALFQARPNFIYRSPSQSYVNVFLRVGNVQLSRQCLDAFFFWMLHHLKGITGILAETWSISSIALNAARLVERYDRKDPKRCHVDMLSSYHDGSADILPEVRDSLHRVSQDNGHILTLISVIGTGRSFDRLKRTILEEGDPNVNVKYLALYKMATNIEIESLCDLSINELYGQKLPDIKIECSDTPNGLSVVEVDGRTYFPLHMEDNPVKIQGPSARPSMEFFTKYQGTGAVRLHRDTLDINGIRLRHHGVDIDVDPLLQCRNFRDAFISKLIEKDLKPAAIIVPPHQAGRNISALAMKTWTEKSGETCELVTHPDLHPGSDDIPKDFLGSLDEEDIILILDDVSVTGERLRRYQKHLRELEYRGRIHYLVGVARPESNSDWDLHERDLKYRSGRKDKPHVVDFVEKILLPDWTDRPEQPDKLCPWCDEMNRLRSLYREPESLGPAVRLVAERIVELQTAAASRGLIDNAIWRRRGDTGISLTENSIFLNYRNASDADIVAAVASTLQRMRTQGKGNRLEYLYPHATVIDPDDYFKSFNDVILSFAILRSAIPRELERWKDSHERERRSGVTEFLQSRGRNETKDSLVMELAIQFLCRKLPAPLLPRSDWEQLGDTDAASLLRCVIHRSR